MPGTTIPLISKRQYDFGTGTATTIVLKAVNVTPSKEGVLMVRVHSGTIGSGSSIAVVAQTTHPSNEDPALDFVNTTPVATASVGTSPVAGTLVKAALATGFGSFLQIKVVGTLSTGPVNAIISAELSVKE